MILSKRPHFAQHPNHQHQVYHHQRTWSHHSGRGQRVAPASPVSPHSRATASENTNSTTKEHQQQAFLSASQSLRQPAPQQPAPQRPAPPMAALNHSQLNGSGMPTNNPIAFPTNRASTLNRLDLLKRRQQQLVSSTSGNPTTIALRRNLSSLGHYPAMSNGHSGAPLTNGYDSLASRQTGNIKHPRPQPPLPDSSQIYAPASVASPREFSSYSTIVRHQETVADTKRMTSGSEQHYASTSVRSHNIEQQQLPQMTFSSRQQTPRPESALGQLLERFGTFRRKARRHFSARSWSSSRRSQTPHSQQIYASASIGGFPMTNASAASRSGGSPVGSSKQASRSLAGNANIPHLPLSQPLVLDPEIYATGKRQVEAEDIYAEGSRALDSNAERRLLEHELDPVLMTEGETRTIIEDQSRQRADYRLLVRLLVGWLNDELAEHRIIVRDLQEDLYDGQVLCKLVEKLQRIRFDIVEVTQNELAQKHKLKIVLETLNRVFTLQARTWARIRWSVEGIHNKNMVEILHLLITMALFYRAPLRLPPNVTVQVLVFQKHQDELVRRSHQVQLTDEFVASVLDQLKTPPKTPVAAIHQADSSSSRRDAFDLLLECAPEKLHIVKQSLVRFCNRHLNKINMSCGAGDDLRPENFSDGLLLVFLISSLEDYFVPLGNLFTTTTPSAKVGLLSPSLLVDHELPFIDANNNNVAAELDAYAVVGGIEQPTALDPTSYTCSQPIEKLHNVNVALKLIDEAGLADIRDRVRVEEIVNGDLKAILRVLYALFGRYKHL